MALERHQNFRQECNDEIAHQDDENEIQILLFKIQSRYQEIKYEIKEKQHEDIMQESPYGPIIAEKYTDPAFSRPEDDRQQ